MPGLNAPTAPLLTKAPGNAQRTVNDLRTLRDQTSKHAAELGSNLQEQADAHYTALATPGAVTSLTVTDASGALIGWVGSAIVGTLNFFGAWFKDFYMGGTSASSPALHTDTNGNLIFDAPVKFPSPLEIDDTGDAPSLKFYSTIASVLTLESTVRASSVNSLEVVNNASTSVITVTQAGDATFIGKITVTVAGIEITGNAKFHTGIACSGGSIVVSGAGQLASGTGGVSTTGALTGASLVVTTGGSDTTGSAVFHTGISVQGGSIVNTGSGNCTLNTGVFVQNGNIGSTISLAAAIAGGYNVYGGIIAP